MRDAAQALKPQLAACKRAADRGFKALVHHIFTEHPSRIIGAKPEIPDCSPDNWKCALQTTLRCTFGPASSAHALLRS